jgi:large subunit ribosomal protein L23
MSVLRRPLITEKATRLSEQRQYAFEVEPSANKIEIRKAVEAQFSVDVTSIRTVNIRGRRKTQFTRRGRFTGKTAARKKAYVTVKEGQTIDIGAGATE